MKLIFKQFGLIICMLAPFHMSLSTGNKFIRFHIVTFTLSQDCKFPTEDVFST